MALFQKQAQPQKIIAKVKVLGIRTAMQTKTFYEENSTQYSILVLYTDGTRELLELSSKQMTNYINYIDM